ncbi:MAG TPA: hypothetical protein VH969_19990 [Actinophytocola sp.]|jgi:hypothetical protein|uniref:hypothetical protein n=1 Tax=Actinophytocola sp. TaxID=1872138 RepID=UPI002F94B142
MDSARHVVIDPLVTLASSLDYRDRADAGRCLAVFADIAQVRESLVALVLDTRDTYVTRATAEAVLRRRDKAGYVVVARALAASNDDQLAWIRTAATDVFGIYASERDAAVRECETLLGDADERLRLGLRLLISELNALVPILVPG